MFLRLRRGQNPAPVFGVSDRAELGPCVPESPNSQPGNLQAPIVDEPCTRRHPKEARVATRIEPAENTGIHVMKDNLTQLGTALVYPKHPDNVGDVAPGNWLERDTDLSGSGALTHQPEAMRCRKRLRQENRLVRGEVVPAVGLVPEDVSLGSERHGVNRAKRTDVSDREKRGVARENGAIGSDFLAIGDTSAES